MKDQNIKLVEVTCRMDGSRETVTKNITDAEGAKLVARVPKIWAHNHGWDTSETDFDSDFIDACETCAGRYKLAVANGLVCAKHPDSYFEAAGKTGVAYCEFCSDSVRAAFAFYIDAIEEIPATASYIIMASEHPRLPLHGNVGGDQLLDARVNLPVTPTYDTWVAKGRPVYRGESRP